MNKKEAIASFNQLGSEGTPFLFIIDFKQEHIIIEDLATASDQNILFSINGNTNIKEATKKELISKDKKIVKHPVAFSNYNNAFLKVMGHLQRGNSYLTNLTFETPVSSDLSLNDIFHQSEANYKLRYKDQFVVFSPEIFVQIKDGKIYSFPMKGTIDASIPGAKENILNNAKESAEHATIVDLIRNDLSCIASNVTVDKYRYIDTLQTDQGELLQVSSKISGVLPKNYKNNLGDLFFKLLPAGSITGAPKDKTLAIIDEAENYNREYYTGIVGIFDGANIDSGVMIRFIEKKDNQLFFKSGGGITAQSKVEEEYEELIRKIYLPIS